MSNKINTIFFITAILSMASLYFILPENKLSSIEKRKLATIPELTFSNYTSGLWANSMEKFIDDQFPFRYKLIEMADFINACKGIKLENQEKVFVSPRKKRQNRTMIKGEEIYLDDFDEAYSGSMLIINGSVYPMGGGSPVMSKYFCNMVNEYANILQGRTRVFSAVAPLSSAFIPVLKYKKYNTQNKQTLLAIKNNLANGAIFCDVFDELDRHSNEKMYFSTDHHWNAKGAYYAYVAFCHGAGIAPIELNKMEKRTKYNFLGSLYQLTKDPSVKANPDSMEYFIPRVKTTAVRYGKNNFENPIKTNVFSHQNSGGNSYLTFLGGDAPLIKITTDVKNGRKAVVVKNSMGNAFAVFLISHYEEIYVVDFRYSNHNMLKIIENNKVNDLIFALGMYGAMSKGTINMMRNLATNNGIVKLKRLEKEDSTRIFNPILDTLKTD